LVISPINIFYRRNKNNVNTIYELQTGSKFPTIATMSCFFEKKNSLEIMEINKLFHEFDHVIYSIFNKSNISKFRLLICQKILYR